MLLLKSILFYRQINKVHDRNGLKQLIYPKDTVIVEDRGYFDFTLMLNRIKAENIFVTRIKTNTVYETIRELDLPDGIDQHILKDEIIKLSSQKAQEVGISDDEQKVISIITNNLYRDYNTIPELYGKIWGRLSCF
jgi:hypothetical protein